MTEDTPLTPEELWQLDRDLMEKVLDRAGKDPVWKQRLLDDPEAAMREAGFPEAKRLQATYEDAMVQEEVTGHVQLVDYVDPLNDYQLGPISSPGLRFLNA